MIPRARASLGRSSGKPRASGDDPFCPAHMIWSRMVNPARAGMIRGAQIRPGLRGRKPRASGDDPRAALKALQSTM